jgi:hypothetical protein
MAVPFVTMRALDPSGLAAINIAGRRYLPE